MAEDREKEVNARHSACTFSKWLLVALLVAACGGIVPPPPKSELKPAVEKTTPGPNSQNVVLNQSVTVTFNKEMDLTASTFFLEEKTGGVLAKVPGNITQTGATAVFKPTSNLTGGKGFTATVKAEAKDLFGNTLEADHSWQFTTAAPGSPGSTDTTPPTVDSTSPAIGAGNVPTNTNIIVTFSEDLDPATLVFEGPGKTFGVSGGVDPKLPTSNFLAGNVLTFIPDIALRSDKEYTVSLTLGIKDLAGNSLSIFPQLTPADINDNPLPVGDPGVVKGIWKFTTKLEGEDD